jgi:hypothetical protein
MTVSVKKPWANFIDLSVVNREKREDSTEFEKDEALSLSGDSCVYLEEGNIAKAARLEEPARQNWEPTCAAAAPAMVEFPVLSCQVDSSSWDPSDAAKLYNVSGWSEGYFEVSNDGCLAVKPQGGKSALKILHLEAEREGPSGNLLAGFIS